MHIKRQTVFRIFDYTTCKVCNAAEQHVARIAVEDYQQNPQNGNIGNTVRQIMINDTNLDNITISIISRLFASLLFLNINWKNKLVYVKYTDQILDIDYRIRFLFSGDILLLIMIELVILTLTRFVNNIKTQIIFE